MGIRYEWSDDSRQIVIMSVVAPWTWQEFRAAEDAAFQEIRAVEYPVATISDVKRMGKLPGGNFLAQLQYIDSQMPRNVFVSVTVGAPFVVTSFMDILMRIRPNAKQIAAFANTLEEAKVLIEKRRVELFPQEK